MKVASPTPSFVRRQHTFVVYKEGAHISLATRQSRVSIRTMLPVQPTTEGEIRFGECSGTRVCSTRRPMTRSRVYENRAILATVTWIPWWAWSLIPGVAMEDGALVALRTFSNRSVPESAVLAELPARSETQTATSNHNNPRLLDPHSLATITVMKGVSSQAIRSGIYNS